MLGKSWKTTLLGLIAGAAMIFSSAMQARANNPSAPPVTFGNLAPGIAVAVLGALAKDHNISGT